MKKIIAVLSFIALAVSLGAQNVEQPKREFRGAWIHIVGNTQMRTMTQDQIREMFIQTLDSLEQAGCNAVIFQVRPQADAFYESELEPWTRFLTGVQGNGAIIPVYTLLNQLITSDIYIGWKESSTLPAVFDN